MTVPLWIWLGFIVFVLAMLALDLGVFHRKQKEVSFKEALLWSIAWMALALIFNAGLWHFAGTAKALEFLTGYLIELSLSVDNLFVFVLLFAQFSVPARYQHRILFWGVLGALILRAIMIGAGSLLMAQFTWIVYVFGGFLVFTGLRMLFKRETAAASPQDSLLLRLLKRVLPLSNSLDGDRFISVENGRRVATPLLLVLVLVEATDLVFAVDSIPAIFAVTSDTFIVYTSNIFAILGLRSLYFALAGMMNRFHYLKLGLGVLLAFVGIKMLLAHTNYHIDTVASLLAILGVLSSAMLASWIRSRAKAGASAPR